MLAARAQAADPAPSAEQEEDPEVVLSTDSWFIRLDLGAAYARAETRYQPSGGGGNEQKLAVSGAAATLQMAIAARLGRDVTLGGLGRLVHAPASSREGSWSDSPQGMYYGELFIDHRLPANVLRLGGGVGPGYIYSVDPVGQSFGSVGPVATAWLGLDLPSSARVAWGLTADVTGAAMRARHAVAGVQSEMKTFMLVIGLAVTLRISEPSWPTGLPSLARQASAPSG